ncbi:MAG TPA: Mur ligase domain-containing protein, partial [Mycobacteriales bacterium]|nr:Mur ligase domain-containing protein [Mycobacteriales bacterium]
MSAPSFARPRRQRPHALAELAAVLSVAPPSPSVQVTGASHVAQAVRPGDLYLARPGAAVHGAQFCAEAVAAGAVAILTDSEGADRAAATGVPVLTVPDVRSV